VNITSTKCTCIYTGNWWTFSNKFNETDGIIKKLSMDKLSFPSHEQDISFSIIAWLWIQDIWVAEIIKRDHKLWDTGHEFSLMEIWNIKIPWKTSCKTFIVVRTNYFNKLYLLRNSDWKCPCFG
jgi:hypothetical protein